MWWNFIEMKSDQLGYSLTNLLRTTFIHHFRINSEVRSYKTLLKLHQNRTFSEHVWLQSNFHLHRAPQRTRFALENLREKLAILFLSQKKEKLISREENWEIFSVASVSSVLTRQPTRHRKARPYHSIVLSDPLLIWYRSVKGSEKWGKFSTF